jgi:hypothetical protein
MVTKSSQTVNAATSVAISNQKSSGISRAAVHPFQKAATQKMTDTAVVQGVFLKNHLNPIHWKDMEDGADYTQVGGVVGGIMTLQGVDGSTFQVRITDLQIGIAEHLTPLTKLKYLPDEPKQYIRINSFAFTKSRKLPIASHSYMTCMGVIIHNHEQQMGGMAHIDTDHFDEIADKINLIVNSVKKMIQSINPHDVRNLEIKLFGGSGVKGTDNFGTFTQMFTAALTSVGIGGNQIHSLLNSKHSAKLAVYFPLEGSFYLDYYTKPDTGAEGILKERSKERKKYGSTDYEDQEEIKEDIQEGNSVIIEIEFDEEGNETNHREWQ